MKLFLFLKRKDILFSAISAPLIYFVNLDLATTLTPEELVDLFVSLPLVSFVSIVASFGFVDYMVYWVKWKKKFKFKFIILVQSVSAIFLLLFLNLFSLNKFISDYIGLLVLLIASQRIVDTLMQYFLLTMDKTGFFFYFYFLRSIILSSTYLLFVALNINPITSYLFSIVISNCAIVIIRFKEIPLGFNKFDDFNKKKWADLYFSGLINSAIVTLETSGVYVISDTLTKASLALASRISSILGYFNTFFTVGLSQTLVTEGKEISLKKKWVPILVIYFLVVTVIASVILYTPLTKVQESYEDKIFVLQLTFFLVLTYWLKLVASILNLKLVFTFSRNLNLLVAIGSLLLTLLVTYLAKTTQNIYIFLLVPFPVIVLRLVTTHYLWKKDVK